MGDERVSLRLALVNAIGKNRGNLRRASSETGYRLKRSIFAQMRKIEDLRRSSASRVASSIPKLILARGKPRYLLRAATIDLSRGN